MRKKDIAAGVNQKTKKIKTAYSFNRISHRKTEAIKKMKEEMRAVDISGYCMRCQRIRKVKDIELKRFGDRQILIGNCVDCGTEIYKKFIKNEVKNAKTYS